MKSEFQGKNNHLILSNVILSQTDNLDSLLKSKSSSRFSRFLKTKYYDELKELVSLSLPTILTSMSHFMLLSISTIMCGHLDTYQMDAAALANSMIATFGIVTNMGFSTACDTLFSQTYGASQKKKMGLYLQRSFVVAVPIILVMVAIHINLEKFLLLLGQDPMVSQMAAQYALLFIPGLFFDCVFIVLARYMQNQAILYPPLVAAFLGIAVNGIAQYVALYIFGYQYQASAICQMLAFGVAALFELIYIIATGLYEETWDGWKFREMWEDHGSFYLLAIAGIFMICFEEWSFEIGTILSGTLGPVQLAAQSIVFQIEAITYTIPVGVSIAVNIRVGNQLGAGNPSGARRSYLVGLSIIAITATVTASLCMGLSHNVAGIFSSDEEVKSMASSVIMILGAFQIVDGIANVSGGALRGCGRQMLGGVMVFIGFYVLALPIGSVLALHTPLGVIGIWIGLIVGMSVEAVSFLVLVLRLDWKEESRKAIERVGDDTPSQNSSEDGIFSDVESLQCVQETQYTKRKRHRRYFSENYESQLGRYTPYRTRRHYSSVLNIFAQHSQENRKMSESTPLLSELFTTPKRENFTKLIISRMAIYLFALSLVGISLFFRFNGWDVQNSPCGNNSTLVNNGTHPYPCGGLSQGSSS